MKGIIFVLSVVMAITISNAFGMNFQTLKTTRKVLNLGTTLTLTNGDTLTNLTKNEITEISIGIKTKSPFEIREQIFYPEEVLTFYCIEKNFQFKNKEARPNRPNYL